MSRGNSREALPSTPKKQSAEPLAQTSSPEAQSASSDSQLQSASFDPQIQNQTTSSEVQSASSDLPSQSQTSAPELQSASSDLEPQSQTTSLEVQSAPFDPQIQTQTTSSEVQSASSDLPSQSQTTPPEHQSASSVLQLQIQPTSPDLQSTSSKLQFASKSRDSNSTNSKRKPRGFTLLEVMISLAILAIALLAIGDINGGAVRMHAYARQLTTAVQLARGQMLDIQQLLDEEGLSDYSKEYRGTFAEQGFRDYRWVAQVIKPELEVDATRLLDMASGALQPERNPGEPIMDNPLTSGPMAGMAATQLDQVIESIKTSVREVKLTIYWKNGRKEESFDLVEHLVVLPDAKAREAEADTPVQENADPNAARPPEGPSTQPQGGRR